MTLPLIGITLDSEEPGGYSKYPWYALRQNYIEAVSTAKGLPLPLPHEPDHVGQYLNLIDGLVVTGGAFDVDPSLFGDTTVHETVKLKGKRTAFELAMVKGAIERDMPILGICGGQQLLAVALGGTLIQHIPDSIENCLPHEQPNPRHEPGHTVTVKPGSQLAEIAGTAQFPVNSAHHQAVRDVPAPVVVNAWSEDGVVEGIEMPGKRFCIGVQWHPEFTISEADAKLMNAFVAACRK